MDQTTVERMKGCICNTQDYIDAVSRAQRVEGLMQDPLVSQHIERIKSLVKEPMVVREGLTLTKCQCSTDAREFCFSIQKTFASIRSSKSRCRSTALRKQTFNETMTELQKEQGPGRN